MRTYTNMAWPDDPYRTGQQLCRRPAPRLTAFATGPEIRGSRSAPAAVATVGHLLDRDVAGLQRSAGAAVLRGLAAVAQDWADRGWAPPGRAAMFACGRARPGRPPLARACQHTGIAVGLCCDEDEADHPAPAELAAALAVERALAIALLCARHLRRYTWAAPLHTRRILAGAAWDCFPHLDTSAAAALRFPATARRVAPSAAGAHRSPA